MPKKGYKQTIAHRKKHSMSKIEYYKTRYSPMKNRLASVETKRKHHLASVGKKNPRFGIILTKAIRKKISIGNKGKQSGKNNPMFGVHRFGKDAPNYGTILSEETRQKIGAKNANQPQKTRTKQRLAALRRIAVHRNSGDPVTPNLGTNEIRILNYIEMTKNIKLKKQYSIDGYFIDGYCVETNTAYEVDEKHHHSEKNKQRDKEREEYIKEKLNCKFVRLDENKYLKKLN